MSVPILPAGARQPFAGSEIQEQRSYALSIEAERIELIAEAQQALVAGRFTFLVQIRALCIEVAAFQGGAGHAGERVRLGDQSAQDAGAPFSRFVEQNRPRRPLIYCSDSTPSTRCNDDRSSGGRGRATTACCESSGVPVVGPGASWRVVFDGGLIHTAVGKVSGRGGPLTNRSGCAA